MNSPAKTNNETSGHKFDRLTAKLERHVTLVAAGLLMICVAMPDDPATLQLFGYRVQSVAGTLCFLIVVTRAATAAIRYAGGSDEEPIIDLVMWKLLTWSFFAALLYALLKALLGS